MLPSKMIPFDASDLVIVPVERYESTSPSGKFWEVSIVENTFNSEFDVIFNYGKIGTRGRTKTTSYVYVEAARRRLAWKINEKIHNGYVRVHPQTTPTIGVSTTISPTTDIKQLVENTATILKDILKALPVSIEAEVIVTVIASGDIFQSSAK